MQSGRIMPSSDHLTRVIAITTPEEAVPSLRALAGLVQIVKDVPIRPACCETEFVGAERALTFHPEAQAGAQHAWEDYTALEPHAIGYMRIPEGLTGKCVRCPVLDTDIDSSIPHSGARTLAKRYSQSDRQ